MFHSIDYLVQLSAGQRSRVLALEGLPLEPVFDAQGLPSAYRTAIAEADIRVPQSLKNNPRSFDDIAGLIDPGTVYVSHPVFVGPPISVWISKHSIHPVLDPRDGVSLGLVAYILRKRATTLVQMRHWICGEVDGDLIRLDGRIVECRRGQAFDIRIHRCVAFRGGTPIAERPYHETIFSQDGAFDRIVAFPTPESVASVSRSAKLATSAYLMGDPLVPDVYRGHALGTAAD